jgi:hypothetical protein
MQCINCGCDAKEYTMVFDGARHHHFGECINALKEKVTLLEAQNKDTEKTYEDILDYGWGLLYPGKKDWEYPGQVINHLWGEIKIQVDKADRLEDALQLISNWQQAYPLEVFPEPDLKEARKLLAVGGITLDSVSVHAMRHVINGVKDIVDKALNPKITIISERNE